MPRAPIDDNRGADFLGWAIILCVVIIVAVALFLFLSGGPGGG